MLVLLWNVCAAIRGYLRFYMPTNRALDWLRSPRGLKWAIPVSIVATPAYLFAMSLCAVVTQHPGLGYLNLLVLLFAWNAMKFAVMGVLSVPMMLRDARKGIASVWPGRQASPQRLGRAPRTESRNARVPRRVPRGSHNIRHRRSAGVCTWAGRSARRICSLQVRQAHRIAAEGHAP